MQTITFNAFVAILFASVIRDSDGLVCYSCDSLFGPCDANSCRAVPGGFCAYQQIVNSNGYIVNTKRSCLTTNLIVAGPSYISQTGQCIETVDPNTGLTYRTYMCSNQNYCNADCQMYPPPATPFPTIPQRTRVLECFKCDSFATDCYSGMCTVANGGYCFYQLLNVSINDVRSVHYSKRCIGTPIAKTPDGNVITEVNKCIISTDILGNRFYTLICNGTNLCNANCYWDPTPAPLPVPVLPASSPSMHSNQNQLFSFFLSFFLFSTMIFM